MTENYKGKRVSKKTGNSHVVWFQESNRWVEFKEPAWFIYCMLEENAPRSKITQQLISRYELPENEAKRFLQEVSDGIMESSEPSTGNLPQGYTENPEYNNYVFNPRSTRHYLLNNRQLSITFGSALLEYYIHRPLAHLEVKAGKKGTPLFELFEIRDDEDKYIMRYGRPGAPPAKVFDEPGMLKHKLYSEITSYMYGLPQEEWMSYIHASAVTNGTEAILLSSSSGSGKSTMAAMLQSAMAIKRKYGQFFMSDDFVPVDAAEKKAYVFPAALSVKQGSYSVISQYYDPADDADSGFTQSANRQIRYLRPRFQEDTYQPRPVKAIVFLKRDEDISFTLEKLQVTSALSLFHQEAWVSHNPGHAQAFIDWFVTLNCYKLEYSDNIRAIEAISGLFR
jgi:hypothetical protein